MAPIAIYWSSRACTDIEDIIEYISRDSAAAARGFARKLIEATEVLKAFPTIGRVVPEFDNADLRELLFRNFRIVYRVSGNSIEIVTVFHGSRPLA